MRDFKYTRVAFALGLIFFSLCACSDKLTIEMPKGPSGASAYEVWVQAVKDGVIDWDTGRTDLNNYFLYLKGQDGRDGMDGKSAYQLWVEEVAKGVEDPHHSGQLWAKEKNSIQDFWYFLTGAKGQNGSTPKVGNNGNWFIDGKDSGIKAVGQDGQHGSVISIGNNGNWFIDGKDTGVEAFGKEGQDGKPGQSAYELWVQEVAKGIDDPRHPGQQWPKNQTSTQDFCNS